MSKQMTSVEAQRALELARAAQASLNEAVNALKDYVDVTGDHKYDRTLIATLEVAASRQHEWLDRSESMDDVLDEAMDRVMEMGVDEDDAEDDEIDEPDHCPAQYV